MRSFLRWLADRGKIISDPSRHIDVPRPDADDLPLPEPPLGEEEVAELLAWMPRNNVVDLRNIAHIELLYSAGLRASESLSLDLRDIDFTNRVVHVLKGKGSKKRDVPMMRGLQFALRDYLCLRRSLLKGPDHGALLLDARGKRLNLNASVSLMMRLNRRRPGKRRVHAHLFRHSIAVHLLRGGADARYVQAFLWHESLESTRIYLRLVPADLRKEYDKAMPEIAVETLQH
jgi:integrase/recombinase XerC